jgi:O-antigen/teichoic acid export membrane protein
LKSKQPIATHILANIIGNFVNAFIGIAFVPVFIRYIGTEGYGLIGIFASFQTILYLFDMGFSTTLNRELARLSADFDTNKTAILNTTRTFEVAFVILSLATTLVALVLSYCLAFYWVNPATLSRTDIFYYFCLLSISFGFMLPKGLYYGGLLGLDKHIAMNVTNVIGVIVKNIGALSILMWIDASPKAFFEWQAFASFLQTAIMAMGLWYYLPKGFFQARFDAKILRGTKHFVLGLTGISLTSIIITQADKFILSKTISLETFGYYTFAGLMGGGILQIMGAVFQTYFPKLSQQTTLNNSENLATTYHQASKAMALVILPLTLTIVFFSKPILEIWTKNKGLIDNTPALISILTLGTAINGLVSIPYALSLAAGNARLFIKINCLFIALLIPSLLAGVYLDGTMGAAYSWLIVNGLYAIFAPIIVHRYLLPNHINKWFFEDTLPVFFISSLVCGLATFVVPTDINIFFKIAFLGTVFMLSFVLSGLQVFPKYRKIIFKTAQ